MQRFYASLTAAIIFISTPALGTCGISEFYDQNAQKTRVVSSFAGAGYFDQVLFSKNRPDSNYTLSFILKQREKVIFVSGSIKFTASVFPIAFLGSTFSDDKKEIITTEASFDASGPTARYILTSRSATITLDSKNFGKINWVVPGYLLEEWKAVIKR
ncbi:MAG: hypothetical protein MUC39_01555 [Candidatus Omnitrophica bacterium]|jgi:hypothetical protein|nr:hypothetical protein [Candidatus Omnitrophota bacterium]